MTPSLPGEPSATPWRPPLRVRGRNTPVDGETGDVYLMGDRCVADVGTKNEGLASVERDRSRQGPPPLGEGVEARSRVNWSICWCNPQAFRTMNLDEGDPDGALWAGVAGPGVAVEGHGEVRAPGRMHAHIGRALRDEGHVTKGRSTNVEGDGSKKPLPGARQKRGQSVGQGPNELG